MNHEERKEQVIQTLKNLFADNSVSSETTRESLEEIKEEVEVYINALSSDNKGKLENFAEIYL